MGSKVKKTFTANGSVTIPAGVYAATIRTRSSRGRGLQKEVPGLLDPGGSLYTWGFNFAGYGGVGDSTARSSPVAVLGGLQFSKVFLNTYSNCMFGITPTNVLYAWGFQTSSYGELGVGDLIPHSSPIAVLGGLKWQKVQQSASNPSTVGLTVGGVAYAWGGNINGQLGDGTVLPKSSPIAVLGGLIFSDIAAPVFASGSNASSCVFAITPAGALYSWGMNNVGQLGVGDLVPRSSPVAVLGGLTFLNGAIALGIDNTVGALDNLSVHALTTAGAAYSWGVNSNGQLGDGSVVTKSSPVAVLGGLTFASITADGEGTVYALTAAGKLYAWGSSKNGQLGDGTVVAKSSPVAVLGGLTFAKVMTNVEYAERKTSAWGLTTAGAMYGWGGNANGQLGDGTVVDKSSPVAVLGGLTFVDFTVFTDENFNGASIYAVTNTGKVYSWGINNRGQLAVGDVAPRSSPVAVLGGILAGGLDTLTDTNLAVVPGTAYTITLAGYEASFGNNVVGYNVDVLTVEYEQ